MATITPFRSVRPQSKFAAQVSAPPYDVVSLKEARAIAEGNPHSFFRVSRAEIELPDETDPYSPVVYERGAENFRRLVESDILFQEPHPLFGVYRQKWGAHEQTGLVALASVDEYNRGLIKKHEYTRPVKENDRVQLIMTHESQSGPVLLFFQNTETVAHWFTEATSAAPDFHFVADDNVEHTVWSVRDESFMNRIIEAFQNIDALYIADGHHRSAAASRVQAARCKSNNPPSNAHEDGFLSVIFPHDQLQILPYNRVVQDLHGLTPARFLEAIAQHFVVEPILEPGDPPPAGFDMYLDKQWYRAKPKLDPTGPDQSDPVRALAVSELTERVLDPVLGIKDQRSDPRIDFVGGVRGHQELAARVDSGQWAVAFWLYPTTVDELMAVADADRVMPPKSTWFEPKLRDGLFIHMLRDG
ncbi:MAG: DUF1015 family protein [Nitrospirales bacterium]|nr:DUF1015 domain-containing protein [Nitrospira sp.]MDR4500844.1 DUF1015 family protein [Nitrospirales bacterium]